MRIKARTASWSEQRGYLTTTLLFFFRQVQVGSITCQPALQAHYGSSAPCFAAGPADSRGVWIQPPHRTEGWNKRNHLKKSPLCRTDLCRPACAPHAVPQLSRARSRSSTASDARPCLVGTARQSSVMSWIRMVEAAAPKPRAPRAQQQAPGFASSFALWGPIRAARPHGMRRPRAWAQPPAGEPQRREAARPGAGASLSLFSYSQLVTFLMAPREKSRKTHTTRKHYRPLEKNKPSATAAVISLKLLTEEPFSRSSFWSPYSAARSSRLTAAARLTGISSRRNEWHPLPSAHPAGGLLYHFLRL